MEALAILLSLGLAFAGQWANRYKSNPTLFVKLATVLLGIPLFWLGNGFPHVWTGPQFTLSLATAMGWALSVQGGSSLFGAHPSMATDSK